MALGPPLPPAEEHYRQTIHDYAGNLDQIPDPVERQRALNDLYYGDPAEAAELDTRRAQETRAHFADLQRDLVRQRIDEEQKALEDYKAINAATEAKMAQAMDDVDRVANTKVDTTGGLSPFQRVAGVLMGLIGGLYQGRTGSPNNIGLDALNNVINRNITEQKNDLERRMHGAQSKMNLLGQEYARHGDMYRAEQTVRMAMYQAAEQQLAIEQQNYEPGGTTERMIAKARATARAGAANVAFEWQKKIRDEQIKAREQVRKEQETVATIAEKKASTAKAYAEIGKIKSELGENAFLTPQEIHTRFPQLPAAAIPPGGATLKVLEKHVETYGKATDAANKEGSTIIRSPVTFEPLPSAAGGYARAGDATLAEKQNDALAQTQQFVNTLADIKRELGTDPSSLDRDKFASIKTKYELAKKDFIKGTGANYTSREVQAVEDMFGGGFEHYTDRIIGRGQGEARIKALIDSAISDAEAGVGTKFGAKVPRDASGKSTLIRDTSDLPTHAPSDIEFAVRRLNQNVWGRDTGDMLPEDQRAAVAQFAARRGAQPAYFQTPEGQRVAATGVPPSQLQIYDQLEADATGPDAKRSNEAFAAILEQANNGPTEAQRKYATAILNRMRDATFAALPTEGR